LKRPPLHFFVPVYFDTESFRLLQAKILVLYPDARIHLLDDTGGLDPAVREVKGAEIHVMPGNLGHQAALVKGLRDFLKAETGESLIVTMDADGEDRPEDLPALFAAFEAGEKPIVLARRTSREETALFKFCYFFYKLLFRALTGTLIRTGNFALFHSSRARAILAHPYFDFAYASSLFALGSPLAYVPCPRGQRYQGQSKMSFGRLALHGLRMLIPFRRRILLRLALATSLLLAAAAGAAWLRPAVRILAIGESTTFLGGENAWPRLLERKLREACGDRVSVASFAVPGSDSYEMAVRIPAGLAIYRPRVVISMLGINDYERTTREVDEETRSIFARGYRSERELQDALLREILAHDPWRDRRYIYLFSRYYRDHGLFTEGVERNEEVLRKWPGHAWALSELGKHAQAVQSDPGKLEFRLGLLAALKPGTPEFRAELSRARAEFRDHRPLDFFVAGMFQGAGDWAAHLKVMRKIVSEGCASRKCMVMLRRSLDKNGLGTEAASVVLPPEEPYLPVTMKNYRHVIDEVRRSGAALFPMQYPLRSSAMLRELAGGDAEMVISNEANFAHAGAFDELFTDRFAGDFGHFTPRSQELVAEAAAAALKPWLKRHLLFCRGTP
jgi:hypothetical protein